MPSWALVWSSLIVLGFMRFGLLTVWPSGFVNFFLADRPPIHDEPLGLLRGPRSVCCSFYRCGGGLVFFWGGGGEKLNGDVVRAFVCLAELPGLVFRCSPGGAFPPLPVVSLPLNQPPSPTAACCIWRPS